MLKVSWGTPQRLRKALRREEHRSLPLLVGRKLLTEPGPSGAGLDSGAARAVRVCIPGLSKLRPLTPRMHHPLWVSATSHPRCHSRTRTCPPWAPLPDLPVAVGWPPAGSRPGRSLTLRLVCGPAESVGAVLTVRTVSSTVGELECCSPASSY